MLPLFLAVASSSWSDFFFLDALLFLLGKVPRIPRFFLVIFIPVGHFPDLVQINKTTFPDNSHFFTLPQPICPVVHQLAWSLGPIMSVVRITLLKVAITEQELHLYPENYVRSK